MCSGSQTERLRPKVDGLMDCFITPVGMPDGSALLKARKQDRQKERPESTVLSEKISPVT